MFLDAIKKVRAIKNCPVCGCPWESDQEIVDILKKSFPFENKMDVGLKALEYNCSINNGRMHTAIIMLSEDKKFPYANYYSCPHCAEWWELDSDKLLTSQEKHFAYVFFPTETTFNQ